MVAVRMIMEMVKSAEERAERLAFEKDGLVVQCVTAVCSSDLFDSLLSSHPYALIVMAVKGRRGTSCHVQVENS